MHAQPRPIQVVRMAAAACLIVALIAFFLPWVHLTPPPSNTVKHKRARAEGIDKTGRVRNLGGAVDEVFSGLIHGTREVAGKLTGIPPRISGFGVPILANSRKAKTIMELAESVTKKKEDVGLKSWAVYAVPGLAVFLGALLVRFSGQIIVSLLVAAAGVAIFGVGTWQLLTANLTSDIVCVKIGFGLWLSLSVYLCLGLLAVFSCLPMAWQERVTRLIIVKELIHARQAPNDPNTN